MKALLILSLFTIPFLSSATELCQSDLKMAKANLKKHGIQIVDEAIYDCSETTQRRALAIGSLFKYGEVNVFESEACMGILTSKEGSSHTVIIDSMNGVYMRSPLPDEDSHLWSGIGNEKYGGFEMIVHDEENRVFTRVDYASKKRVMRIARWVNEGFSNSYELYYYLSCEKLE